MHERNVLKGEELNGYLSARPYLALENIPFAEDIAGKYVVRGWGDLTRKIEDPNTLPDEIGILRTKRAKLFMDAVHHSDVYFGPVREAPEESPEPVPSPEPNENPNEWRIVRAMKNLGGAVKGWWGDFQPFASENKGRAAAGVLVGALAGFGIVSGVHLSTEAVMSIFHSIGMSHPSVDWLIGGVLNVGGSWFLNREVFLKRLAPKWADKKAKVYAAEDEKKTFILKSEEQEWYKYRSDYNGVMASLTVGDIGGKMLAAGIPIDKFIHRFGDMLHWFNESVIGNTSGTVDHLTTDSTPAQIRLGPKPFGPEPQSQVQQVVEVGSQRGVEHIVSGNSEMLTKILVDHGLKPYSGDYIRLLSDNKDTFAEMLKKTYPSGNVPVLENLATNKWEYVSVEQAIKNLNEVISAGYPDPLKMSESAYRAALTKMFNSVRYLLPGTKIEIPTP